MESVRWAQGRMRVTQWTRWPLMGAALLGMSLLLAACGAAGATGTTGATGASADTSGGASSGSTPSVFLTPIAGASSVRPNGTVIVSELPTSPPAAAPGGSNGEPPAPTTTTDGALVVLTPASGDVTTSVKLGQLVQAQLPNDRNWAYVGQSGVSLTPTSPSGTRTANGVYLWTFRAEATGDATLHFTGQLVCQPNVACTPLAFTLNFALRVTE